MNKKIILRILKALIVSIFVTGCIILFLDTLEYQKNKSELENLLTNPPSKQELIDKEADDMSLYGINGKIYSCQRCLDSVGGCDRWENKVCTKEEFSNVYQKQCEIGILSTCPFTVDSWIFYFLIFITAIPILPSVFLISLFFFYYRDKQRHNL